MNRPLVEQAFMCLTHKDKGAFGGLLDESTLTMGGHKQAGEFLVAVATDLKTRVEQLPDTPPAPRWKKSAKQRLLDAIGGLKDEGTVLMEMKDAPTDDDRWWMARCMFVAAPWVWMTAALLDEFEASATRKQEGA